MKLLQVSAAYISGLARVVKVRMRKEFVCLQVVAALSMILGGVGGWLLQHSGIAQELKGPFIRDPSLEAAALNAALFVALVLAGALLLCVLVKVSFSLVRVLGYFAFFFASFLVLDVFLVAAGADLSSVALASPAVAAIVTLVAILRPTSLLVTASQLAVGALTGSIIASMVPPQGLALMLAAVALYDLLSVYKGPLRYLLERVVEERRTRGASGASPLTPLVVNVRGLALGMGDVILYASLSSLALLAPSVSPLRLLLTLCAAQIGLFLTLCLLSKRKYAPALPLPVFLSLATYVAYNLLTATPLLP